MIRISLDLMAGCALGVVSERGERASSRRVRVNRRCEFGANGKWYTASIEDVSVHGARLHIFNKHLDEMLVGAVGEIRFRPYSGADLETLPLIVRNIEPSGDISNVGCQYVPKSALDHRLIADLMFANSDQWTQFQASRRRNPGLIRGTIWFLGMDSCYKTRPQRVGQNFVPNFVPREFAQLLKFRPSRIMTL